MTLLFHVTPNQIQFLTCNFATSREGFQFLSYTWEVPIETLDKTFGSQKGKESFVVLANLRTTGESLLIWPKIFLFPKCT